MSVAALLASLVLAAVFAIAAVTKLTDRTGTRQAIVAFGAPAWSAVALALILPLAELTVAGLLLFPGTALYGAIGALVLLAIFSVAIGVSLARGRAPDCHCFGQLHSAPASWKTLAHNGVLAGLAVVSLVGNLADEQTSAFVWLGDLEGAELVALIVTAAAIGVIVVGGAAFVTLMRSYGKVLVRLDRMEGALVEAGIEFGDDEPIPEIGLPPDRRCRVRRHNNRWTCARSRHAHGRRRAGNAPFHEPTLRPVRVARPGRGRLATGVRGPADARLLSDGFADEVRAEAEEHMLETAVVDEGNRLTRSSRRTGRRVPC